MDLFITVLKRIRNSKRPLQESSFLSVSSYSNSCFFEPFVLVQIQFLSPYTDTKARAHPIHKYALYSAIRFRLQKEKKKKFSCRKTQKIVQL